MKCRRLSRRVVMCRPQPQCTRPGMVNWCYPQCGHDDGKIEGDLMIEIRADLEGQVTSYAVTAVVDRVRLRDVRLFPGYESIAAMQYVSASGHFRTHALQQ